MRRFLHALDLAIGAFFFVLMHDDAHILSICGATPDEARRAAGIAQAVISGMQAATHDEMAEAAGTGILERWEREP